MAYTPLFYLDTIAEVVTQRVLDGSHQPVMPWKAYKAQIQEAVGSPISSAMIMKCLRAICPSGFPRKWQQGSDRAYYIELPSRARMIEHIIACAPPSHRDPMIELRVRLAQEELDRVTVGWTAPDGTVVNGIPASTDPTS